MSWLKQSTTITIRLGPFLDKTDGVTEETGITPVVEVSKNHGAFGARSSATAITHDANGWFAVELNTTDTGTLGPLLVKSDDSATHLPVWREFLVVPANVYDSLVAGSDTLQADVTQFGGTNGTFSGGRAEVNASHWAGAATASDDVALATAPTNFAALAITAAGKVTVGTNDDKTGYGLAANAVDSTSLDATAATEIADALLKRDMSAVTGEAARSPLNALRLLRNKWSVAAGTMTVTKEDDVTSAWTSAVVGTAGADPITSSDPA